MERITRSMLENFVKNLNIQLGRPATAYRKDGDRLIANVGNLHIEGNSPGDGKTRYSLLEMHNEQGGVANLGNRCYIGASSFYDFLVGFREGIEAKRMAPVAPEAPANPLEYRVGSVIEYALGNSTRTVTVTEKIPNIEETGRAGFDGILDGYSSIKNKTYWGYDSQITRVIKY